MMIFHNFKFVFLFVPAFFQDQSNQIAERKMIFVLSIQATTMKPSFEGGFVALERSSFSPPSSHLFQELLLDC